MNELINNKKEKWEVLYEFVNQQDYGTTILHSDIEKIIEESHESTKYMSIITKTKKKLIESSKCLKSLHGQGYTVIQPDEYTDLSLRHIKRGSRQIGTGYKILQYAPVNQMSQEGLSIYRHVSDRALSLQAKIIGGCTELKLLSKKSRIFISAN